MKLEWPFVGRTEELQAVRGALDVGPVLLRGPAGIGKTRLAREVTNGRRAVWLVASNQLAAVRYGALTPLFTHLAVAPAGDDGEFLARLHAALTEQSDRPVIVVDDVGRADSGTLAALSLIASGSDARLVLTSRDTDPIPEFVRVLYDAGRLVVVDVGPLARDAVDEIVSAGFDSPVTPDTLTAFVTRSGGNPLLLRELVRGAIGAGTVVSGPNGVQATPAPTQQLSDLVGAHFIGLPVGCQQLAELLAVAGPLHMSGLDDDRTIERLESDGLLAVSDDGTVGLDHPLFGEVLSARLPRSRLRTIRRDAAARLRLEDSGHAQLRSVLLTLDNGDGLRVDELVPAAVHALATGDHHAVVRITAAGSDTRTRDAVVLRLRGHALSLLGEFDAASLALEEAVDVAHDDEERARACRSLAEHLAVRVRKPKTAVARIDAVLGEIVDQHWRAFLAADRTRWAMLTGEQTESPDGTSPDSSAGDEVSRLNVIMTDALVAVMAGRLAAADRQIRVGLPLADRLRGDVPHGADLLRLTRWAADLFGGRLDEAREFAVASRATAGAGSEPSGMWDYAIAVVDLHAGRVAEAARRAASAVRLLEWRDFTGLVTTARAVHATALAQLGRAGEARTAIEQLGPVEDLDLWAALQHAQALAWLAVAEGRRPPLEDAAEVSRRGVAAGHVCLAAFTSHVVVCLGSPSLVVDDLRDLALRAEGALIPTIAAHASAAAAQRPGQLLDAAEQLARLGLVGAAARAARQASGLLDAAGQGDAARHAARRADGWSVDPASAPRLSARELQIAGLAGQRWSSRAIADQLGVSIRTVDNHLRHVYRKLEISGRSELVHALRSAGLGD